MKISQVLRVMKSIETYHVGFPLPGSTQAVCREPRKVGGWLKEKINHVTVDLVLKLRRHARDYSRSRRLCSRLKK